LKATLALAGACVVILLLNAAIGVLAGALHDLLTAAPRVQVGTDTSTGVFAVVDQPVRTYIAAHCASRGSAPPPSTPCSGRTLRLVGGFFRSSAPASPGRPGARPASPWSTARARRRTHDRHRSRRPRLDRRLAFALRGLSLRRALHHIHNAAPRIEPHIHLPAPAAPRLPKTPDNMHLLQQR